MRLLRLDVHGRLRLTKDLIEGIPKYAILSHTWGDDADEVTFNDIENENGQNKAGYKKLWFCMNRAHHDELQYCWIDTCCIDRANHVELSEAITSMFRWYRTAVKCYVYLADVPTVKTDDQEQTLITWNSEFRCSRWFKRGWTLQELLAPKSVEFFAQDEQSIGSKKQLEQSIHEITEIPIRALQGESLSNFSVAEKMRWAADRNTKRKEDKAYCLLGIFDVSMGLRYGEGEKAFVRLENKVNPASKYRDLMAWLAPVHPDELQNKISASRHPGSGSSFVAGPLLSWLQEEPNRNSLLWITGKSGTGKTALFSLAVETIKTFTSSIPLTLFAYHYCTFTDLDSQLLVNILGSFVVQISAWQPGILEDFKAIFERHKARRQIKTLQIHDLEQVLVKHVAGFNNAIILIDALDESEDFLESVSCILRLLQRLPNLKVMVTTTRRASTAVTKQWPYLIEIGMQPDQDILAFVEAKLASHEAFRHLSFDCKRTIKAELIGHADHSFRWVCLIMDNLCRQRTGKAVMKALQELPKGLNETYAGMLGRIPSVDRNLARESLLWLSFARRQLTIIELSEAVVLEESDTTLNQDARLPAPEVILEICHGFLEYDAASGKVKLAHSSVRSYLLSDDARSDGNPFFSFDKPSANQFLTEKCLTYLMFDDFRSGYAADPVNLAHRHASFPLLDYAARFWGVHASFATQNEWILAEKFFSTRALPQGGNYGAWVHCLYADPLHDVMISPQHLDGVVNTEPLYFAASFGIAPIVQRLISHSASIDLEKGGGRFGSTALQVACFRGNREVSEILLTAGADFWSDDPGSKCPAWYWAQVNGWTDLVQHMIRLRPEIADETALSRAEILWAKRFQRDQNP